MQTKKDVTECDVLNASCYIWFAPIWTERWYYVKVKWVIRAPLVAQNELQT